jgi:hypothetical protein
MRGIGKEECHAEISEEDVMYRFDTSQSQKYSDLVGWF